MVRVAEISRFLGQGAEEVREMLDLDGLPHAKVPGKTKPSVRVALRDLHGFMLRRWQGETVLRDFAVFAEAFWGSQEHRTSNIELPTSKEEGVVA
jgi:hypothetical protein